jgi:hypothetical protein
MNSVSMGFFKAHFAQPEMRLLLAGCRRMTGSIDDRDWEERVSTPFDEEAFSGMCRENRLSLVIDKSLVRPHRNRFSPGFAEEFEREARWLALHQLRIAKSMVDIHRSFRAGNIRHLFLKGPALNGALFGGELLRCSRDLDVLIEPRNLIKAVAILAEAGFDTVTPRTDLNLQSPFFRMRCKDVSFWKNRTGPVVELHWKTDRVETILNRRIFDWDAHIAHVPLHGESLPVMEDYHNCLYLCLHAAKHHWRRLQWLLDIALLMQRRGMEADRLLALARRYGLRNVVLEAFCLCRRLLNLDFGNGDQGSWEKHAAGAVHRFHLNSQPVSPRTRLRLNYHRGLLYPMNGPRQGFWMQWITDRTMKLAERAALWKA